MKHFFLTWLILFSTQTIYAAKKVTPMSAEKMKEESLHRRAVETAIWGMPLVNFDSMRQAYLKDVGAVYNDIVYLSRPADQKFQVLTPNNTTNYVFVFSNLKAGPVVLEIPRTGKAALFGSVIDAWNVPMIDVGNAGHDKGKGAKYLLLPPGYKEKVPKGYVPVRMETNNLYTALRIIPKSSDAEDISNAIAYLKTMRVYPLNTKKVEMKFIDIADKQVNGLPSYDDKFYSSLARMVREEPVKPYDLYFISYLEQLGIKSDQPFSPDQKTRKVLSASAKEAHEYMKDGFKEDGFTWWSDTKWKSVTTDEVVKSNGTFVLDDKILVDKRAFVFASACAGTHNPMPNLYVKTFEDSNGKEFNGSNTYRLRVPANVPTTQYWSVVAYDKDTAGFIKNAESVGIDSYNKEMTKNPDGSVDIYFSPTVPTGLESNWISTAKGKPYFIFFRNYAPKPEVLNRTSPWTLNDVEQLSGSTVKEAQEEK